MSYAQMQYSVIFRASRGKGIRMHLHHCLNLILRGLGLRPTSAEDLACNGPGASPSFSLPQLEVVSVPMGPFQETPLQ